MRVLIVEDDENKRTQLINFLSEEFPDALIETAKSLRSGLINIINNSFDIILLDMTMPTFDIDIDEDGGKHEAYAGRDILRQMNRRNIKTPVLVVTQFDRFGESKSALTLKELNNQLKTDHEDIYLGSVYYNVTLSGWRDELRQHLINLKK